MDSTVNSCDSSEYHETKKPNLKKVKRVPGGAVGLYIKLYCNKKCLKGYKLPTSVVEAAQSWLTLSDKEKQQFYNKYKECQRKHIQVVGNCLQKAHPYMKKKLHKGAPKNSLHEVNIDEECQMGINLDNIVSIETNELQDTLNVASECKTEINNDQSDEMRDDNNELHFTLDQTKSEYDVDTCHIDSHDPSNVFYAEPTPPSIKTGKELFEIINCNDDDVTWNSLTHKERYLYSRAVCTLKQDYIHKYKQYLEQLPLRELFDFYNKTFY